MTPKQVLDHLYTKNVQFHNGDPHFLVMMDYSEWVDVIANELRLDPMECGDLVVELEDLGHIVLEEKTTEDSEMFIVSVELPDYVSPITRDTEKWTQLTLFDGGEYAPTVS